MEDNMKSYKDGDEMRDALPNLHLGDIIAYRTIYHQVIDAGEEQGHRIAAIKPEDLHECVIHGLYVDSDCPRC